MPKKILLADDSITIQKVVELTFSDADYEVTAVNNGAKAVAKLTEMRPDIILSDIIMPEKNGYEVCEYVKSHPEYRNIPVVLLTGTFEPFDPDRAEKAGCDAVVTKPFESQSLIQKVEELIAQASASAAPAPEPEPPPAPEPSPWSADTEVVPLPSSRTLAVLDRERLVRDARRIRARQRHFQRAASGAGGERHAVRNARGRGVQPGDPRVSEDELRGDAAIRGAAPTPTRAGTGARAARAVAVG